MRPLLLRCGTVAVAVLAGMSVASQASAAQAGQPGQSGRRAAALPGYEIVTLPAATVKNHELRLVSCPRGKVVIGGGAQTHDADGNGWLSTSYPTTRPIPYDTEVTYHWGISARHKYNSTVSLSGYAICASKPAGYQQVQGYAERTDRFTERSVQCPGGKVLMGGGGEALGDTSTLTRSYPEGTTWRSSGFSTEDAPFSLRSYALCANPLPGHEIITTAGGYEPFPYNQTLACPSGKAVLGGGARIMFGVPLNKTIPEPADAAAGYRWSITAYASIKPGSTGPQYAKAAIVCASLA
ncbi:hypothetical protein ACIBF1_20360 [Spirillospora sp. NPDC050679]